MSKQLKDVQQLINDKADAKLYNEVRKLQTLLYSGEPYNITREIKINVGTCESPKVISLYSVFSSDGFEKQIIENNTERYRAMEAELFLSKVESLREDVDCLLDNKTYD